MKILLIETEPGGHHVSLYLNSLVDKLMSKKHEVTILTNKQTKNSKSFSYIKKKKVKIFFLDNYKIFSRSNYFTILLNQFILFYEIKKKINYNKFDHIYFNTFSVIDKAIAILGPPFIKTKFSGLIPSANLYKNFSLNNLIYYKNLINKFLFNRVLKLKNLENIFIPDNKFVNYVKNKNFSKKVKFSYDFGHFNEGKQSDYSYKIPLILKNKPKNKIFILVYGSIRYEKGIQYLLKAISSSNKLKKISLIIAGKQDQFSKKCIEYYKKNNLLNNKLIILDYFIPKKLETFLFKISHYVWTGYTKNYSGSSAVYFLSSVYFKPVISSNHGLINFYNKKYKNGFSVEIDNVNKIKKLLYNLAYKPKKIDKKKFLLINKTHNQEKFSDNICKFLLFRN